jgi:crotonobetainyl-CoA:carnitine CoA-transferase CaiB-like acyl-CoA transferase
MFARAARGVRYNQPVNVHAAALPRPLEDITVLDMTTALAGPFATLLLGGLGARVIKIENPLSPDSCRTNAPYMGADGTRLLRRDPDDISLSEINRLRNKLGVTLNLKKPGARDILSDLMTRADIVVENYSRGALDRLGLGYSFAKQINPKLVYCSLTGFGSDTEGSAKAMDAIIQALSGVMMTSGRPEDPPVRIGVPFADLCTPLFCVIGILSALHQAQRTGLGQHVDVSMLGVMTMLTACEPFDVLARCGVAQRTGERMPRLVPFGIYKAADGYVAICAPQEQFAHALFRAMGQPELSNDPRFATRDARVVNIHVVDGAVEQYTSTRTKAEILATFAAHDVPSAEVRDPQEAVKDPRVLARKEIVPLVHPKFGAVEEVRGMGMPIRFSGSMAEFDQPPPGLGEHNDKIYGELLGYSAERLAELKSSGVI